MKFFIPVFMILAGGGILFIWTREILNKDIMKDGFFHSREPGTRLLWPHWVAEYGTALGLMAGGAGLILKQPWAYAVSLVFLGGLVYASLNSLGWVFGDRSRFRFAIPMSIALIGALVSVVSLSVL